MIECFGTKLTQKNLKKLRVEVRMIEEEVLAGYQNATMSAPGCCQCDYELKKMSMVVDASHILDVTSKCYWH